MMMEKYSPHGRTGNPADPGQRACPAEEPLAVQTGTLSGILSIPDESWGALNSNCSYSWPGAGFDESQRAWDSSSDASESYGHDGNANDGNANDSADPEFKTASGAPRC